MFALILDCEGEALEGLQWASYSMKDRHRIFELVSTLHKIGIKHLDLEPRNIVRGSSDSFRIIDFSQAVFHDCPGINGMPWRKKARKGECDELKDMWRELVGQQHVELGTSSANTYPHPTTESSSSRSE